MTVDAVRADLAARARSGRAWWQLVARRRARQQTSLDAPAEAERRNRAALERYQRLAGNEPTAIMELLEAAFEDNDHPAAPIDCRNGAVTVLLMWTPKSSVPTQVAAVTPTGRPTLHQRPARDRYALYVRAMGSTVLATVKETLATCPALHETRVLVVRRNPEAPTPGGVIEAIYAGRFPAARVRTLPWATLDPVEQLLLAPDALMRRTGAAHRLVPLDLRDEPELAAVVEHLRTSL